MPLGRGLSSLIPPKEDKEENVVDDKKELSQEKILPYASTFKIEVKHNENKNFEKEEKFSDYRKDFLEINKKPKKEEAIFQVEVEKIVSNPYQPRKNFDENSIIELAESIKQFGILQPLVVSKIIKETENGVNVEYHLIAGERRLRAAKMVGLERVPVIIRNVEKPGHKLEMALIENIQRSDLNPIEEAKAYAKLQDEFGLTQREIASRVGKSREAIANSLRLLNLPEEIQEALAEKKITESQARILLSIQDREEQKKVFESIIKNKLSVRDVQNFISRKSITQKENKDTEKEIKDPQLLFLEKELENKIKLPVKIKGTKEKGKIIIEFYSEEDIENLKEIFDISE